MLFEPAIQIVVHYLADAYNEAIFKEILEAPASSESDFNALNEEGFTPLHLAAKIEPDRDASGRWCRC
ncbi:hypothetical protein ANCCAN_00390 [Ancylostoma caninum]|uniref:Ankyrin repeat protein n=1 Tax=Ancylostoma caninum TaxID=29170 RepID=A0A368HCA0_ANCCA|nr:hypothetical protein ANCCAN_00390 [Ancylostoma caninum]